MFRRYLLTEPSLASGIGPRGNPEEVAMRSHYPFDDAPFDQEHLASMALAYELVSRDFGLEPHEIRYRRWVKQAVLECAHQGIKNRGELRKCATKILKQN